MAYVDLATLQTIAAGQPLSAATVQQIRDNEEFLIDPPACSVFNTAAQEIAHNAAEALTADSENFDNDSMHSTSSNTTRITIQTAGRYLVYAHLTFEAHATGVRAVNFKVNGTTTHIVATMATAGASVNTVLPAVKSLTLAAGSYVEVEAYQTSGTDLDCTMTEYGAKFFTR